MLSGLAAYRCVPRNRELRSVRIDVSRVVPVVRQTAIRHIQYLAVAGDTAGTFIFAGRRCRILPDSQKQAGNQRQGINEYLYFVRFFHGVQI